MNPHSSEIQPGTFLCDPDAPEWTRHVSQFTVLVMWPQISTNPPNMSLTIQGTSQICQWISQTNRRISFCTDQMWSCNRQVAKPTKETKTIQRSCSIAVWLCPGQKHRMSTLQRNFGRKTAEWTCFFCHTPPEFPSVPKVTVLALFDIPKLCFLEHAFRLKLYK